MSEFILEIGTEEMPARFVPRLGEELAELFSKEFELAYITCQELKTFATPRRLVVYAHLNPKQQSVTSKVLG